MFVNVLQLASVVLLFYLLRMRGNCTASQIPEIGDTYGSMHVLEEDENIMILQKDEVGRPMVFMWALYWQVSDTKMTEVMNVSEIDMNSVNIWERLNF